MKMMLILLVVLTAAQFTVGEFIFIIQCLALRHLPDKTFKQQDIYPIRHLTDKTFNRQDI